MSDDSYSMRAAQDLQVSRHVRQVFSHSGQSQPIKHSRQARRQSLQALMHLSFSSACSAAVAVGTMNVRHEAAAIRGKSQNMDLVSGDVVASDQSSCVAPIFTCTCQ